MLFFLETVGLGDKINEYNYPWCNWYGWEGSFNAAAIRGNHVHAIGRSLEKLAKLAAEKDIQQLKIIAKDAFA